MNQECLKTLRSMREISRPVFVNFFKENSCFPLKYVVCIHFVLRLIWLGNITVYILNIRKNQGIFCLFFEYSDQAVY